MILPGASGFYSNLGLSDAALLSFIERIFIIHLIYLNVAS